MCVLHIPITETPEKDGLPCLVFNLDLVEVWVEEAGLGKGGVGTRKDGSERGTGYTENKANFV